jgi:hypothetical protein
LFCFEPKVIFKKFIFRKELERRKQLDECNSLSNCSISSASASSSGSQSISFLEEIKMLGDHGKRNLRPVNITDRTNIKNISKTNDSISNNIKPEDKSKLVNPIKCDNSEKHKQHGMKTFMYFLTINFFQFEQFFFIQIENYVDLIQNFKCNFIIQKF